MKAIDPLTRKLHICVHISNSEIFVGSITPGAKRVLFLLAIIYT